MVTAWDKARQARRRRMKRGPWGWSTSDPLVSLSLVKAGTGGGGGQMKGQLGESTTSALLHSNLTSEAGNWRKETLRIN